VERGETSKLGVIVNELGEVGIDGALLGGESARQIELPGGCVCCVLGDELDTTLLDIVDQNPSLSAILLETTGVAEPLPIAWAVRRAPVDQRVRLAAVVTLVDALHFVGSRGVSAAVDAQVAYADVVLVTKSEIATDRDIDAAIAAARELAPQALIRRGTTDEHAAWLEQALADPSLEAPANGQEPAHVHDEHCRHPDNGAVHGIDSVWLPVTAEVDLEELEDQLATLPDNYVRIKGIVRSVDARDGVPRVGWTVIHRVGLRVSSEPVGAPNFEEGRLVALGPRVERAALAACVEAAVT
jgi:G3E family GTPase